MTEETIRPEHKINNLLRLFLVLILSVSIVTHVAANTPVRSNLRCFHDSILVKVSGTMITGKIKLYANISSATLLFSAVGSERKMYQLFLFDMDGKLVSQTQVRDSETALLSRFERGNYMFEVFNNDDRIEFGSIVVK